jgi:MFS family permease
MQSELKKIYLANFFAGLSSVASVIYTLYFLSNGISQTQIGQLFGVFMISMSIFNIPTGAFADVVGHKTSVVIGLFFHAINGLIFYFYPTFPGMIIGMLSAGLGLALQTGAWSSLTYEILEKTNKVESLAEVMGKAGAYFALAAIIGSLLGAPIFKVAPKIPFLLFFICIAMAGVVATQIQYRKPTDKPSWSKLMTTTKDGIMYTVKNQKLMGLMIITIAMTTGRMLMNQNIGQPYQVGVGVDIALIGVIAAIAQLIQMGVSVGAYKVAAKIGYDYSLIVTIIVPAAAVFLMGRTNTILGIGFMFIFGAAQAFKEPIAGYLGQKVMTPTHRATMASTSSVISSVIVGILLPIGGRSIDLYGINYSLILLAAWTLVVGGVGVWVYRIGKS